MKSRSGDPAVAQDQEGLLRAPPLRPFLVTSDRFFVWWKYLVEAAVKITG